MSEENSSRGFLKPVLVSVVSTLIASVLVWLLGFRDDPPAIVLTPNIAATPAVMTAAAPARPAETNAATADPPAEPARGAIHGVWQGSDGLTYSVQQLGPQFTVTATQPGALGVVLEGRGVIANGNAVVYYFRTDGIAGVARFQLSANGRQWRGAFNAGGAVGEIILRR